MSNKKPPGCGSCKGCPSLKLVKNEESSKNLDQVEERNFFNTCPRKLERMPTKPCALGKPTKNDKGRILQEPSCPWWIDSEKHNYCFWKYLHEESIPDGRTDPLMQNEIAEYFGCSSTKIHFVLKDALKKLKDSPHLDVLQELGAETESEGEAEASTEGLNIAEPDPLDDADGS